MYPNLPVRNDDSNRQRGIGAFGYHHLVMQPECFFRKHGEFFVINGF